MKILLIYPYCLEDRLHAEEVSVPPIGLYYVAAVLKESGYDVEILNWHRMRDKPQGIREVLSEQAPDIIGFSILHANRWGGIEIARAAKEIRPAIKIVFGGAGATFLWEHFLTHFKDIDVVVLKEGEVSFLKVVQCLEKEDPRALENIQGIAFRKGGRIVKTPDAHPVRDLDSLPNPAEYFTYQHVSSSRGCPANCTFCGSPRFWGRRVRSHSPEKFLDQLELLYKKGVTFFYVSDDTFTIKKDRVIEICKGILQRNLNITWVAISRVNYVSEEVLYWMRLAGCIQISYGVESGSEKIRDALNKDIKTQDIKRAFALTQKYGILARAYFIYGCPGEDWTTIQETIDLILEIQPLGIIFYILDIFPGTALYMNYQARSGMTDDIWLNKVEDILYLETDPRLSKELVLAFGKKLRTTFYEHLPGFAEILELIDNQELYPRHADFLSRLAMTFTHGEYAGIDAIRGKARVAERLFRKALTYHPDHRAYLGLGMLLQRKRANEESVKILSEGARFFPLSESLNMCLGMSYMNLGQYEKALSCFLKFPDSKEAARDIAACREAISHPGANPHLS